ncbi:MAG: hypothetical protein PHN89_04480 [Candidatus Pacebacteria bacterium]|nr:hypothetical protein [Candidatus Paceibacterota bacterium]
MNDAEILDKRIEQSPRSTDKFNLYSRIEVLEIMKQTRADERERILSDATFEKIHEVCRDDHTYQYAKNAVKKILRGEKP